MSHTSSSYLSYNPGEKSETTTTSTAAVAQHKEYQLNTNNSNNNLKSDQQARLPSSSSSSLLDSYDEQLATTATSDIKTVVFNDINNNYRDVKNSNEIIDVEEVEKDEVKAASSAVAAVEASIIEEAVHLKGKKKAACVKLMCLINPKYSIIYLQQ